MVKISVSIDVSDLNKAVDFYVEALGCKKVREQGENMTVIAVDNCDIYLQEKAVGTKPLPTNNTIVRDYARHWSPVHLDFLCEDVEKLVANILKTGGSHEGGESGEWGSIAYCADPFGNGFCVINE